MPFKNQNLPYGIKKQKLNTALAPHGQKRLFWIWRVLRMHGCVSPMNQWRQNR